MKILFFKLCFLVIGIDIILGDVSNEQSIEDSLFYKYIKELTEIIGGDRGMVEKLQDLVTNNITMSDDELFHNFTIRSKLDEAKRRIIEEINKIYLSSGDKNTDFVDNTKTRFSFSDFQKITEMAKRFYAIDEAKSQAYKKHVEDEKIKAAKKYAEATDEARKRMLKQYHDNAVKHSKHAKVNQPGSRDQMVEYWEKNEGLPQSDFNPKLLFMDLDLNADGVLDVEEIEGLIQYELNKIYNSSDSDFDPFEEDYDMQNMRVQLMKAYDKNQDMLISYQEFVVGLSSPQGQLHSQWISARDDEDRWQNEESLEDLAKKYHLTKDRPDHPNSAQNHPNVNEHHQPVPPVV